MSFCPTGERPTVERPTEAEVDCSIFFDGKGCKNGIISFFCVNNIPEKISPFRLVKSSAVFFENSAEKS